MAEEAMGHVCPPSVIKFLNSPFRKLFHDPQKIMGEYVKSGDKVIDVGCGGGYFSVALAEMVGENGRVMAVDLQEEMLNISRKLAQKKKVVDRITFHKCESESLALHEKDLDFALAAYMIHEVPNRVRLFQELSAALKPGGLFLAFEPKQHVSEKEYKIILQEAGENGFEAVKELKIKGSRSMLFKNNPNK